MARREEREREGEKTSGCLQQLIDLTMPMIIIIIIIIIMAYTAAIPQSGSSYAGIRVISASDIGQASNTGEIPLLFEKCCGIFKVPRIGLVEVARLGQRLNVPTQGQRVAQTGDERLFSLTALGSDPQPGIEPGPHW